MATRPPRLLLHPADDDDEGFHSTAASKRREIMDVSTLESDLDFAFSLQLQEAIDASLSLQPFSPPSPQLPPLSTLSWTTFPSKDDIQDDDLWNFEQEHKDRKLCEEEVMRTREDLLRRSHDRKVALEIERMPEEEWDNYGDHFELPYGGEGSSSGSKYEADDSELFRIYCKGLVSDESVLDPSGKEELLAGIGVAICDSMDKLIFQLRKPLCGHGINRRVAEAKALIEGLSAAISLGLKRIVFYCDYHPLYQFVTSRWFPRQQKVAALVSQITLLRKSFTFSNPSLVARNDIKFAFKFAREAILSQISRQGESSNSKKSYVNCVICLEDTEVDHIFSVDGCMHRYCFSCMKQHVEVKLLHGLIPKCPHEGCTSELLVDSCRNFLTPKLIDMMNQHLKEASIPVTEKVYCPYPKCSALMSKKEVLEYSKSAFASAERSGIRKCIKCGGLFCINCKVPWHTNMICSDYKGKNPHPLAEDAKLKNLAARNLWRQCVKCNHMIELAAGCFHMTCRCGYEFCYTCGAEWKDKKATCSCPLWEENNIVDEDSDEEEEDYYYDSDSDDYF